MNSLMERWIGSCRRELLDRTLVWNQRHLMTVLREYEDFYNTHRPHRTLNQAAPLRPLPDAVIDLDHYLCVPKTSSRSCDQPIFVDQPSDPGVPSDAVVRKIGRFG